MSLEIFRCRNMGKAVTERRHSMSMGRDKEGEDEEMKQGVSGMEFQLHSKGTREPRRLWNLGAARTDDCRDTWIVGSSEPAF